VLTDQNISDIEKLLEQTSSAQGYVWQDGEVLLDWTAHEDPVDVFAVQKSVITVLIGIAEEKYLLETLDNINHHLDPEWTKLSPWDEAKLSIDTLLSMTTGMADDLSLLGEINETWRYNNIAYNYLKQILTLQSDMSLQELSQSWLFDVIGMVNSRWVDRDVLLPNGKPVTALVTTAADISKVGQLVLGEGQLEGNQILPAHFVEQMLSQSPTENPAWSWGYWNNTSSFHIKPMREEEGRIEGSIVPNAPADLIAARGAYGNYMHIVPSQKLVIVRTCLPQGRLPQPFEIEMWGAIN
jgi:CubicO group peptidase (beta-lactamase class C family)